jgi:hypothetical protein
MITTNDGPQLFFDPTIIQVHNCRVEIEISVHMQSVPIATKGVLDTTLCDKVSSTNKTDHHDITEILLKVALNTMTPQKTTTF